MKEAVMAGERSYFNVSVDTDITDADQNIDALVSGGQWDMSASKEISFSFIDSLSDLSYTLAFGAQFSSGFSAAQQTGAQRALDMFASVIDVSFVEIGNDPGENNADGTLRFMNVTGIGSAFGYSPFSAESGGDMAFAEDIYASPTLGSYAYTGGMLHELGHAMGLKNSFVGPVVPEGTDNNKFTVMSNQVDPDTGELSQTYQIYDIIAMQDLWGANTTLNTGDDSYLGDTDAAIQLVMDAGGTDIFDDSLNIELTEPAEHQLTTKLLQFAEAVEIVAKEGTPNLLCNYLFELAGNFMTFYEACPILKTEEEWLKQSRLKLALLTANTLKTGLDLLGIDVMERM